MIGTPIQSPEQLNEDLTDALISIVDEHTDAVIDLTDNIVGLRPFPDTPLPPGHDIIVIPRVTSQEGFKAMSDFVATLPDEEARARLGLRLTWRKPFRGFLLALTPDEQLLWQAYRAHAFGIIARFRVSDADLHFDGTRNRVARLPTPGSPAWYTRLRQS